MQEENDEDRWSSKAFSEPWNSPDDSEPEHWKEKKKKFGGDGPEPWKVRLEKQWALPDLSSTISQSEKENAIETKNSEQQKLRPKRKQVNLDDWLKQTSK